MSNETKEVWAHGECTDDMLHAGAREVIASVNYHAGMLSLDEVAVLTAMRVYRAMVTACPAMEDPYRRLLKLPDAEDLGGVN